MTRKGQPAFFQVLFEKLLNACNSAPVLGRPLYLASFTQQGYCVLRWVAVAIIPLWLVTLAAHAEFARQDTRAAALSLGHSALVTPLSLLIFPILIGIASALLVLIFPRKPSSISANRTIAMLGGGGVLTCEGLQLGFTHGAAGHMPSYAIANLLVLALFPLRIRQQVLLAMFSFSLPVFTASATGLAPTRALYHLAALLTLPAGAAVIGITLNRWHYRNFRQRRLVELRLQRRTEEVERQKREIDRQRAEAEARREEAERNGKVAETQRLEAEVQRARAWKLLAGALTTPIAEEYERHGHVKASTKHVVIIYCDAVNFSKTCEKLQPERVVDELRWFFRKLDDSCLKLGVEPLRGEGDARIAVAGLGMEGQGVPMHRAAIGAALAMLMFRRWLPGEDSLGPARSGEPIGDKAMWPARIGINLGPVAAGVIDTSPGESAASRDDTGQHPGRIWFDVWGDTVNIAARLAQHARPNQILTRERLLWETGGLFEYGPFHQRKVKNNLIPDCVEILGIHKAYRDDDGEPTEAFWEVFHDDDYRPVRPDPRGTFPEAGTVPEKEQGERGEAAGTAQ
jgi:class 3 adenylate cyclase